MYIYELGYPGTHIKCHAPQLFWPFGCTNYLNIAIRKFTNGS